MKPIKTIWEESTYEKGYFTSLTERKTHQLEGIESEIQILLEIVNKLEEKQAEMISAINHLIDNRK